MTEGTDKVRLFTSLADLKGKDCSYIQTLEHIVINLITRKRDGLICDAFLPRFLRLYRKLAFQYSSFELSIVMFFLQVRRQSYIELDVFRKRWKKAVEEDECWVDPYQQPVEEGLL